MSSSQALATGLAPIVLPANQPADRFYAGGAKIAEFRGSGVAGPATPEDWVASTTTLHGERELGHTVLPDGRRLIDAIDTEPEAWLGAAHLAAFGHDTRLLTKLLDAGQRLPVHAHPDGEFAARHLGRPHGKAEAWYILSGGAIHLGFREAVSRVELAAMVARQDTTALLDRLHRIEVATGDRILVPPGMVHAIGAGVFLTELQEPEDLSILLEWKGYAIDGAELGHLGVGFDLALEAVRCEALPADGIDELVLRDEAPLLPPAAAPCFRLDRYRVGTSGVDIEAGFSVLLVIEGGVVLCGAHGRVPLRRGQTVLVPHGAGALGLEGMGTVLRCAPPHPRTARRSSTSAETREPG